MELNLENKIQWYFIYKRFLYPCYKIMFSNEKSTLLFHVIFSNNKLSMNNFNTQ